MAAAVPVAAGGGMRVRALTAVDGLGHDACYALVQDATGFVWVGTEEGLARFDGYGFRHFGRGRGPGTGLSGSDISALCEGRDGSLWSGSWGGGLDRLDPERQATTSYRHDPADPASLSDDRVYRVLEDRRGRLWVATYVGLSVLDPGAGRFRRFLHAADDPASLTHDRVWDLAEAADGTMWVATEGGLDRMDPDTGRCSHLRHDPADPGSLAHPRVRAVLVARDGAVWVGTQKGVQRLRPDGRLERPAAGPDGGPDLAAAPVTCLAEDRLGTVWVGVPGALFRWHRGAAAAERVLAAPADPRLAIAHEVEAVLEDRSGMIWVATRGGGLRVVDPEPSAFAHLGHRPGDPGSLPHATVTAVLASSGGDLWVGTLGGLARVRAATGVVQPFRHRPGDPSSLADDAVFALAEDAAGALWVGTDGGVDRLRPDGSGFDHLRHDPADPGSLSDDRVLALLADRSGALWVGTRDGLNRLGPGATAFERFGPGQGLTDDFVRCLLEDAGGTLWVGTEVGGLLSRPPGGDRFAAASAGPDGPAALASSRVFSLVEDRQALWVGTPNGLGRRDRGSGRWSWLDSRGGLPNDTVNCILPDAAGRVWLATNDGLARLDPATGAIRTYDQRSGLDGQLFSRGACDVGGDGRLLFGALDGLVLLAPSSGEGGGPPPPVVLTGFAVFNQPRELGRALERVDEIVLSHRDHTFTFELAALDYSSPETRRYLYRLEGLEVDWSMTRSREVRYTSVPPGRYVFRARATDREGAWAEPGLAVRVVLEPPLWRRLWFRLGLAAALLAAGLAGHGARVRRLRRQKETLERLVSERTAELERLNRQKDEFLGIAAHDLRSPLGSVTSTTDLLLHLLSSDRRDPEVWRRFLTNIRTTTEQMRRLVDDLLDVAAIQTGRIELRLEPFPLADLLAERAELHGQAAANKGIGLELVPVEGEVVVVGDRARVAEVVDNLVGNAVKFTAPGGTVRVRASAGGGRARVEVEDTGQGLDPGEVEQAFTGRKLSARPTGGEKSTGLGLVIVRKVVELHGGEVWARSVRGRGSTFGFSLPLAPA